MTTEMRWLPVVGFERLYEVSSDGFVRRINRTRPLAAWVAHCGYAMVWLSDRTRFSKPKGSLVHRLVAEAFHGARPGLTVNHRDGVKTNNRADNLEWVSVRENQAHAIATGLRKIRGRVTTHCEHCGAAVVDWPHRSRRFCSVRCRNYAYAEAAA